MQKVLKTPRLCIELGCRQVEKIARSFEKMHHFVFITFSPRIDENLSLKVRNTMFAIKFNNKSRPGALFWAKDRFLVHFWVPEGTQQSSNSYEYAGVMEFEARLFGRID